jgi:hypothetical protein
LIETAELFTIQASNALRLALRLAQFNDTEANRKAAMENRTGIDLAVGILMAQSRCTQGEALGILRSASSHRNIKVRDVAKEVVASVSQGEPPKTHFEPWRNSPLPRSGLQPNPSASRYHNVGVGYTNPAVALYVELVSVLSKCGFACPVKSCGCGRSKYESSGLARRR